MSLDYAFEELAIAATHDPELTMLAGYALEVEAVKRSLSNLLKTPGDADAEIVAD